jgi:hypothetical protein
MLVFAGSSTSPMAARCRTRGMALLAYLVINFGGMLVFGRDIWLQNGEVFAVVFAVRALRSSNTPGADQALAAAQSFASGACMTASTARYASRGHLAILAANLRPPAVGLLNDRDARSR